MKKDENIECLKDLDKIGEHFDIECLKEMAMKCPIGREVDFILGLKKLGFKDVNVYKKAVIEGFAKRFEGKR